MAELRKNTILLVDDKCLFCSRCVAFLNRHGGKERFRFVSLYSGDAVTYLKMSGLPEGYKKSLVLIENNRSYVKSGAALRVFRKLHGIYSLLYLFIIVPRPVRDFVYDLIAKYRKKF